MGRRHAEVGGEGRPRVAAGASGGGGEAGGDTDDGGGGGQRVLEVRRPRLLVDAAEAVDGRDDGWIAAVGQRVGGQRVPEGRAVVGGRREEALEAVAAGQRGLH